MRIAALMIVHSDPGLVLDTLWSVRTHMTLDILVVHDAASDAFRGVPLPCHALTGFRHGHPRAPYRNLVLGLKYLLATFPDADYYCYLEPDVLVASDGFLGPLRAGFTRRLWCLGNDHREGTVRLPLLSNLIARPIHQSNYLLGCLAFYHRDFLRTLAGLDFFDRFLALTQPFEQGFYPGYAEQGGYDLGEHLLPTLAVALGGRVEEFAHWREGGDRWHGAEEFPLRWRPDLPGEAYPHASLLHPIKDLAHPARVHHRAMRNHVR